MNRGESGSMGLESKTMYGEGAGFSIGQEVKVRRSPLPGEKEGRIEDGWVIKGFEKGGQVVKVESVNDDGVRLKKLIPLAELEVVNPPAVESGKENEAGKMFGEIKSFLKSVEGKSLTSAEFKDYYDKVDKQVAIYNQKFVGEYNMGAERMMTMENVSLTVNGKKLNFSVMILATSGALFLLPRDME